MTSEEQEYWVKHYPHEVETIITLCDLFDETQDEATKAQISYAIGVLRKKEKYAWHDLRKNPEDLPEIGLLVDTRMISCETGMVVPRYACLWKFCNQMMWKDVCHGGYEYKACDAWRYIDPLEDVVGAIEQGCAKIAISSEGAVKNNYGDTIKMELMDILKGEYYNPRLRCRKERLFPYICDLEDNE